MTFSQREAELYDLPYTTIASCIHQALRKVYPKPPTVLKNGLLSLARETESTTAQMFAQAVEEKGLKPWFDNTPKAQGYYDWLVDQGDENFIVRTEVYRNKAELANQFRHVQEVAKEMLDDPYIYPSPSNSWLCTHCQMRGPCLAADDGSDHQQMLQNGYEYNIDR
jgi:hypothetical protein